MGNDFNFKWDSHSLTIDKLVLEGCLDRSIDPDTNDMVKRLKNEVETRSSGKLIIIDLNNFKTWDTEGIRAIIGKITLPLISKQKAKIGFCGPKTIGYNQNSQLYEDAKIKFGDVGELIPWEDTIEKVIEKLTSD